MREANPGNSQVPRPGWIIALILSLGIAHLSLAGPAAAADGQAYQRLAILSSSSLQQTGIADLVASKLQQSGIRLVERDQLQKILQEQSLAMALGAADAPRRTKMGRLANAEALVLRYEEGTANNRRIAVVMADCSLGARLSVDSVPESASAEDNAGRIGARVAEVRHRFAGGLKAVIGAPPFISHNFTYEYHPLQSGYAALLRDGLAAMPGIAVVEVEEAQSIRHELELGGGKAGGVWPAFVDADFEVQSGAVIPTVDFTITVRATSGGRKIEKRALTLSQAAAFVAHELPRDVLPDNLNPAPRPLTPVQEFTALAERADSFANLGEFSNSIDLRQAALVLDPDSLDQRSKLSSECVALVESYERSESRNDLSVGAEPAAAKGLIEWQSALESLEWQLHRSDDPKGDRIRQVRRALIAITCFYRTRVADEAQRAKRDFILRMASFLDNPKWPGNTLGRSATLRAEWARTLIESAARDYLGPLKKDDYDVLIRLLNSQLPQDLVMPRALTDLLFEDQRTPQQAPELNDFVKSLGQSPKPRNQFLSQLATLNARVRFEHADDAQVLQEIEVLDRQYQALQPDSSDGSSRAEPRKLESLRAQVMALRDLASHEHPPATRLAPVEESHTSLHAGALWLEQLPLHTRQSNVTITGAEGHSPAIPPGLNHVLRCGNSLTLFWNPSHLMAMREPGTLEEILTVNPSEGPDFADCQWDGKHIWLATLRHGLWQLDATGAVTSRVGNAQGLPPCDRGARVATLGADRLIVAAAFGPTHRTFLALIKTDPSGYQAIVFHKAPRVIDQQAKSDVANADLAFVPQEMTVCYSRDGSGPFVVVRRLDATRGADAHPLIVDCRTMNVAVAATPMSPYPFLACADGILSTSDLQDAIVQSHPSPDGRDLVADFPPLQLPRAGTANSWAGAASGGWAVAEDRQVYLMGKVWFRLDPRTWTACRLTEPGSPAGSLRLGGAAHFGFVAWDNDATSAIGMFRVSINELHRSPVDNGAVK